MKQGIFITGTGTDVGKTFVSALVVKALRDCGVHAGYFKPALSGAYRAENGGLVSGDAEYVCRVSGLPGNPEEFVSYRFEPAVSPHLAAQMENRAIDKAEIQAHFLRIQGRYDYVVAEGCGGLFCPLRLDEETLLIGDVARMLGFPLLIVAPAGLGAINAAVLTAEYAKSLQLPVQGIVLNGFEAGNPMHEDNRKQIERFTGVSTVCVERDAVSIETDIIMNG